MSGLFCILKLLGFIRNWPLMKHWLLYFLCVSLPLAVFYIWMAVKVIDTEPNILLLANLKRRIISSWMRKIIRSDIR